MQKNNKDINNDPFLKVIKDKLENHSIQMQPDDSVWEEIESRLDSKKKINFIPWISVAAAVACIALLWLTIPFNNQINSRYHENEPLSQNEPPVIQDISEEAIPEPIGYPVQESLFDASVEKTKRENPTRLSSGFGDEVVLAGTNTTTGKEIFPHSTTGPVEKTEQTPEKKEQLSQEEAERLLYAMMKEKQEPLRLNGKKKKTSLGLYIGSGNNYVADNNNPLLSGGNWSLRAEGPAIQKSSSPKIQEEIYTDKDFEEVNYRAPLAFGLSVRYPLSNRFAIETGITYTYLSTSFNNKSPKRDAVLRLHYLGIPVNAVANIYETGRWKFYLSAGGIIEKGIYSYYAQNTYNDLNDKLKTVSPDKDIDDIQLSIHLSPGVEFRFDKNYSVYLEAKAGYYFDNKQPISIRTEQPFNVGVSAGLRFNL